MRKYIYLIFYLSIMVSFLTSINLSADIPDMHTGRISLDYHGLYSGVIPSASGSGIMMKIHLFKNYTFKQSYEYLDKSDTVFTEEGTFSWLDDGNRILLYLSNNDSIFIKVEENRLRLLDTEGQIIEGNLSEFYLLEKED